MNRLVLLILLSCFLSACASTEAVVEALPEPAEPEETDILWDYDRFYNEASLLVMQRGNKGEHIQIGPTGRKTFVAQSQDSRYVVLGVANVDVSGLYLIDREAMTSTKLHQGAPDEVYTGDWAPDDSRFYFGHYQPAGDDMGAGNILSVDALTGESTPIGCSASKAVLSALPDGSLLVRNTDNMYQVAVDGCATLRSIDARRMHHVTVSPDGEHLVYVLRELEYNRETRAYEPDSTLYIEKTTGSEPAVIVGDKYRPRNMTFSADGSEVAFDVAMPDDSGRRDISIYSIETGRSSYLISPAANSPSRTHPSFSPGGEHVLFVGSMPSGKVDLMYRTSYDNFTHVVDYAVDASGGMFTMWAGPHTFMITETNGGSTLIGVGPEDGTLRGLGRSLVHILPKPASD